MVVGCFNLNQNDQPHCGAIVNGVESQKPLDLTFVKINVKMLKIVTIHPEDISV